MLIDPNEMLFIRTNAPHGLVVTLAKNIGMDYNKVRSEMHTLKNEYPDKLVIEARRLLKAMTGQEFKAKKVEA